jgi:hypothetical protein
MFCVIPDDFCRSPRSGMNPQAFETKSAFQVVSPVQQPFPGEKSRLHQTRADHVLTTPTPGAKMLR